MNPIKCPDKTVKEKKSEFLSENETVLKIYNRFGVLEKIPTPARLGNWTGERERKSDDF